jgi:hypothetical protein
MAGFHRGLGLGFAESTWSGKGRSEVFMEKQVLNQTSIWYSYGLALLVMFVAVAGAAIKDLRLANAAAKAQAK